MESDASPSVLDPIEKLAEEYLKRIRRGEHPTPAEYAARYPELAGRILELFPALELLEGLKPSSRSRRPVRGMGSRRGAAPVGEPAAEALGDYTILRELGRGGMGIVYEAEHESLKNRVALKVMHPRFRTDRTYLRRFQTEARSAARLHHTNIVPVFDFGEQDGVCYYAMQYIAGVGLDRVLDDVRRLRRRIADDGEPGPTAEGRRYRRPSRLGDPVSAVSSRPADRPVRDRSGHSWRIGPLRPWRSIRDGESDATAGDACRAASLRSASRRRSDSRLRQQLVRRPARDRSTSARSPGWVPRWPTPSTTPTARASSTATSSPPTSCSTRRATSG